MIVVSPKPRWRAAKQIATDMVISVSWSRSSLCWKQAKDPVDAGLDSVSPRMQWASQKLPRELSGCHATVSCSLKCLHFRGSIAWRWSSGLNSSHPTPLLYTLDLVPGSWPNPLPMDDYSFRASQEPRSKTTTYPRLSAWCIPGAGAGLKSCSLLLIEGRRKFS